MNPKKIQITVDMPVTMEVTVSKTDDGGIQFHSVGFMYHPSPEEVQEAVDGGKALQTEDEMLRLIDCSKN